MLLRFLAVPALLLLATPAPLLAGSGSIEMSRTTGCGCCGKWAEHMEAAGYDVAIKDVASGILANIKKQAGIPEQYAACHTAKVDGYVVEGHVPAEDVERLLKEKPDAVGLAVPGMPMGSPGMKAGGETEPYEVLLVKKDGSTEVFAKH